MNSYQQLTNEQVQHYQEFGYVVANSGLDDSLIGGMEEELDGWIELSRNYDTNFGETVDGKARFDLEVGHTREVPRLRRIANPADISEVFQEVLWDGPIVDMVAQLVGQMFDITIAS